MAFVNDITLGQYYPAVSFVHRLDPRTKLIAVINLMTGLLITFEPALLFGFLGLTILIVVCSRLPVALVLRNLRPFIWLFFLTILVHLFWTQGDVFFQVPIVKWTISKQGLSLGVIYAMRLALLIIIAAILTLSTSPIELTDALEKLMAPLNRIKVPVHEIVMMLTLSLRFIPTLLEEAQRLRNAQISRGATFDGSLVRRIKSLIPLLLPLFVSAFRRADDLALAMDSRCYAGGEGRTSFRQLQFRGADIVILSASFALLIGVVLYHTL